MRPARWVPLALLAIAPLVSHAEARALSVEVWTDRGHRGVYRVGDPLVLGARVSDDAYLLVYEIDAEGYVHLLFPDAADDDGFVRGGRSYELPGRRAEVELVVRGPVGEGTIVAIASYEPFLDLPWYLRPPDLHAGETGWGEADDEQGITAEGRVVGDPFVAMERIRRRVLEDPGDYESFATAYTTYYAGHEVAYPRYLCNDCHRPGHWAWWSGFDPYRHHCSVFDFRVNVGWVWGRRYWGGYVPYYVFVTRDDCPPRFRHHRRNVHSSWDGWRRWREVFGGPLRRWKTDPAPIGTRVDPGRRWPKDPPPGAGGGIARKPRDVGRDPGGIRERRERPDAGELRERMRGARDRGAPSPRGDRSVDRRDLDRRLADRGGLARRLREPRSEPAERRERPAGERPEWRGERRERPAGERPEWRGERRERRVEWRERSEWRGERPRGEAAAPRERRSDALERPSWAPRFDAAPRAPSPPRLDPRPQAAERPRTAPEPPEPRLAPPARVPAPPPAFKGLDRGPVESRRRG